MEEFYIKNNRKITICPECSEIINFELNFENFSVSIKCKNGHNKTNISYDDFAKNYIKPSQIYKCKCFNCFNVLYEQLTNYKCNECNKLFCSICIIEHMQKTKHNSKIKFIHKNQLCQKHNQKYSLFCETCRINICEKCKNFHSNHSIKSFIEIIPNKKQQASIGKDVEEFENKIDFVLFEIQNFKKEIDKRYNKIFEFLEFLKENFIDLLKRFNYNYFDYYNFQNFNYILNSSKNENIFDINKYKNYLINIDKKIEEKEENEKKEDKKEKDTINDNSLDNNKGNKKRIKKNEYISKDIGYINYLENIQYLKDNIFFILDESYVKFFEFKDFSFNLLMSYNLGDFKILNIQKAEYSNEIFLNFKFKKLIRILEYDITKKSIQLSKKQIKGQRIFAFEKYFNKCIDNKNGNILTLGCEGLIVWKKDNNKNYIEFLKINHCKDSLYIINENLFCFQDYLYKIYFYNTLDYQCSKIINYKNKKLDLIGIVNSESIVFEINDDYLSISILIVDIKFLEIVQIIKYDKHFDFKIKNNNLYAFYCNINELEIIKNRFDKKEKCFVQIENNKRNIKLSLINNIIITDINYIAICSSEKINLLNI